MKKYLRLISKFTLHEWIFSIFCVFWVFINLIDYLNKQVVYEPSILHFKYFKLLGFFIVSGFLLSSYATKTWIFKKVKKVYVNGLSILAIIIVLIWAITLSFNYFWKAPLDLSNYMHLAGKAIYTLGGAYIMVWASYTIGSLLREKIMSNSSKKTTWVLIDISLGLMIYTFGLMLLGVFALLNTVLVLALLAEMILIHSSNALWFLKKTLWQPISIPKNFSILGGMALFGLLVYLTLNYLYTQAPFPLGFDARNYYVNIPKLIADSEALVPGFQPYAWGLVMSTGYIAFNSSEITLFISSLGGILALFAIYDLCKTYLKINPNLSIVLCLLFVITPAVTNQWIIEFKIDLALLFIQLSVINLILYWYFVVKKKASSIELLSSSSDTKILILISLLFGYTLAIKVLSVFLIFGLFIVFWHFSKDFFGILGFSSFSLGIVIMAKLDEQSGLRDYHISPDTTSYGLLAVGILFLLYSFIQNQKRFFSNCKTLIISGLFMILTFSPWVYKNYTFTKSTSFTLLLLGEKPSPSITVQKLIENYENSLNPN